MNIFDPQNNLNWRDYFKILKRRFLYFLIPFVGVIFLGIHKVISTKPLYESSCYIYVQPTQVKYLPSSLKQSLPGVSRFALNKHVLSKEYFTRLIDSLDLDKDPIIRKQAQLKQASFPEKSVDEIVNLLLIKMLKNSIKTKRIAPDIISINARTTSPELAYSLVKTLTEIYINDSIERAMSGVQDALSFNDKQIAYYKKKLEAAEKKLENFKRNLISKKVENESLGVESLNRIHNALIAVEIVSKEKSDYLNYLNRTLGEKDLTSDFINNEPSILELKKIIEEKVNEMANLLRRFSWKSPEVISANRKINDSRDEIKNKIEKFLKESYPDLPVAQRNLYLEKAITEIDIEIQKDKEEALNNLLNSFKEEKTQDPSNTMTLSKLEAEVALNRRLYNMFLQQSQSVQIEERLAQEVDAANRFKIIEPPNKPVQPINAGTRMILIVTLLMAIGCGSGAVIVREYTDQSVRTINEAVNYFQMPVIGVLPTLDLQKENKKKRMLIFGIGTGLLLLLIGFSIWYLNVNPKRLISIIKEIIS